MGLSVRDTLVVCDMDGTLLNSAMKIAACDIETIRLWRMLGGRFTVATGRGFASVAMYRELARIIDPAITGGGTVIYDFKNGAPLRSMLLAHRSARNALRDILRTFPGIGAMVMADNLRLYIAAPSREIQMLADEEEMTYFVRSPEDLTGEWNKILFAAPPDTLKAVDAFVTAQAYPGVYFVRTHPRYYEMMPQGVDKGSALMELCGVLGVARENTYAIGDYYNDIAMMRAARHAVAMRGAPKEVLDMASEVTAGNNEGGVGQFLYRLISECGG